MRKTLALLFVLGTLAPAQSGAQRDHAMALEKWEYFAGDDPRFSQPDYDDSSWKSLTIPGAGHPIDPGFVWYRYRLSPDIIARANTLLVGPVAPAYEVFADGIRIGQFGGPLGDIRGQYVPSPRRFTLPGASATHLIAIRAWHVSRPWGFYLPDFTFGNWIGNRGGIDAKLAEWELSRLHRNFPFYLMCSAIALASLFFMVIPLWRRDEPEYFWCGAWFAVACIIRIIQISPQTLAVSSTVTLNYLQNAFSVVFLTVWLRFIQSLFRSTATTAVRILFAAGMGSNIVAVLLTTLYPVLAASIQPENVLLFMSCATAIYVAITRAARGRATAVGAIHFPVALYLLSNFLVFIPQALRSAGISAPPLEVTVGGATFEFRSVALLLFSFAMAILLNRRSGLLLAAQAQMKQELAAAAEVQSLLLGKASGVIPGFETDSVYLPASEVGGDFYQIVPLPAGATLVAVGDVSGKGLQAAMMVSLLVGCLRRESSTSPAIILSNLNHALSRQDGHKGFVTCCCVVLQDDGRIDIANAGHPSPWMDGIELDIPPGLPLGIQSGESYEEIGIPPMSGKWLTIISDGVVEAASAKGELFGFDRTRAISGKSANEIAEVAKAWGQNDDITVVTVRRTGCPS